jgi:hypothetical protein
MARITEADAKTPNETDPAKRAADIIPFPDSFRSADYAQTRTTDQAAARLKPAIFGLNRGLIEQQEALQLQRENVGALADSLRALATSFLLLGETLGVAVTVVTSVSRFDPDEINLRAPLNVPSAGTDTASSGDILCGEVIRLIDPGDAQEIL